MLYRFTPENLEMDCAITLSKQLRFLRRYNAVTQQEIADALCVDRSTYAYYEMGKTQPPLFMLVKLARLYEVSTDYLLGLYHKRKERTLFEQELLLLVRKYFSEEKIK